jgi:hypothetical protein
MPFLDGLPGQIAYNSLVGIIGIKGVFNLRHT